jgi:hypothetical protein
MKLKTQTQTYNDGVLSVYKVKNMAAPGDQVNEQLEVLIEPLCYEEMKVGITRFWAAKQEQLSIERLLRTPRIDTVRVGDVVIPIDGQQHKIIQVQYPSGIEPKSMDLSLERVGEAYDIIAS